LAQTKQIINFILLFFIVLVFIRCASQMSPLGGEVDKVPPTIISTYPINGTVNFKESEIEFSFSEYVNKRNINEAFFVSPLIEGIPEFSWTNKTVYIEFPESLKNNTTYSIIIGTEITDFNNNNKMSEPFILTFSTGAKIDSGKISGNVYASKTDGTLIFAYKIDTGKVDIYKNKPSYISQVNDKGYYELSGLGDASYHLFAVKDEFKDLVYNIGDDHIGISGKVVDIDNENRFVKGMDFQLQKEDTLFPNIQAVTMTDMNHLVVEFNEALDSSKISVDNFTVHDSTNNKSYALTYLFKPNPSKNELVLVLSDSLSEDNELFLNVKSIPDINNNMLAYQSFNFIASDKPDTNFITLGAIKTTYEKGEIDYLSPSFTVHFSDGLNYENAKKSITFLNKDSSLLPINLTQFGDAAVEIKLLKDLKPKTQYSLSVNMNNFVDIAGNINDTIISKKISTIGELDFSGASGILKSSDKNIKVVLKELKKLSRNIQVDLDGENKFTFERILPGKYLIWAYSDRDSNNMYSHGNIEPLKFAEPFIFYADTLNLRARWPVGDIEIELLTK